MEFRQIDAPPPDVELGFPRQPLKYVTVPPTAGIGPETGVMLFICPWGMAIEDEYIQEKLLPHLAETYNCLAVAANYFGIGVKRRMGQRLIEAPGWRAELARRFGAGLMNLPFDAVFAELVRIGLAELPGDLPLVLQAYPEYQSFGLQPALDHIAVLAAVLRDYPVRHDRIYGFGSSYGGYIACLMLKLMPNSFHAVVENSGFTEALPSEMASMESNVRYWFDGKGIQLCCVPASPWTLRDPASKFFVGPAVLAIRDCTVAAQYAPSRTHLTSYHAEKDGLIPLEAKRRFWAAIGAKLPLRSVTVDDRMIDGRLFKSNAHGMDASLQLMANDGFGGLPPTAADRSSDFSRGSIIEVPAGDRLYRAVYRPDLTVEFSIVPAG
ncbi:MAG: hypothetical protein JWO51_1664 [Rhodospirillales bacterium]|nr:hypothetical protein [Rhodospirillales bacterium]